MKQTELSLSWQEVNKQIQISKASRIPWKQLLGLSLTRAIKNLKDEGLSNNEIYKMILIHNNIKSYHDLPELCKRLKISLSARTAEASLYQGDRK